MYRRAYMVLTSKDLNSFRGLGGYFSNRYAAKFPGEGLGPASAIFVFLVALGFWDDGREVVSPKRRLPFFFLDEHAGVRCFLAMRYGTV